MGFAQGRIQNLWFFVQYSNVSIILGFENWFNVATKNCKNFGNCISFFFSFPKIFWFSKNDFLDSPIEGMESEIKISPKKIEKFIIF